MVKAVIGSQEALDDIDSIAEFISRDSLYHAQQVVEKFSNWATPLLNSRWRDEWCRNWETPIFVNDFSIAIA